MSIKNPNDRTRVVHTPYGAALMPLDFDIRHRSMPVNIKEADGSSIASCMYDNGELVGFKDGPYINTGTAFITLQVGVIDQDNGLNLEEIIHEQILPGFGIPDTPLDAGA